MFPWQSGSNGREETDLMFLNPRSGDWIRDNTRLQRHVNAAIVFNVWQYYCATGDSEFPVRLRGRADARNRAILEQHRPVEP